MGQHRRQRPYRTAAALAAITAAAGALAGCGAASSTSSDTAIGGQIVPLRYLAPGSAGGKLTEPRLSAAVTIGGNTLNVLVDTGSTGLKVLADKVGDSDVRPTGKRGNSAYLSGLQISGNEAVAPVALGPVSASDVSVLLVDTIGCSSSVPDCEAAGGRQPEEFGGVFEGIMGIGMALRERGTLGCCANPMQQLTDNGTFVVHFDQSSPQLWVNPNSSTLGRFQTVSLKETETTGPTGTEQPSSQTVWDPTPIQTCVTVSSKLDNFCAPTVFDTGTPDLVLLRPPGQSPAASELVDGQFLVTTGQQVTFSVDGMWSWNFQGASVPSRVGKDTYGELLGNLTNPPFIEVMQQSTPTVLAGLPIFTAADVLFDLGGGRMGVASR